MKQLWIATLLVSLSLQLACTRKSETTTEAAREPERVEPTEPTPQEQPRTMTRSEYTPEMARSEVDNARRHHETVGGTLDDAWIHAKIVGQLIGDRETEERKINIDVDNGVVTLRGTVDSMQQKQEADRIAAETEGVKRVNNRLTVSK